MVNNGGKQDLNRSPQEDKCLVGTENDRWRCIGIVLQAISCEGLILFSVCYKEEISFGSDSFDNSYFDLTLSALTYT